MVKLGRIRLKAKNYRLEKSDVEDDRTAREINDSPIDIKSCGDVPASDTDACRICTDSINKPKDPLIAPCKCTGSMKFIHVECLKYWLNKKLKSHTKNGISYHFWNTFECEICKEIYPCIVCLYI